MQLSDPVSSQDQTESDGGLSGDKQEDFIETFLQYEAASFALQINIIHWRKGRYMKYIYDICCIYFNCTKQLCLPQEPFENVEETSLSMAALKHKCPHILQRKNSLPESFIVKKERKRKSKNVAFITSYNGLILQ